MNKCMIDMPPACQLYLISPPSLPEYFPQRLAEALAAGGIGAFQLRLKDATDEAIRAAVRKLLPLCRAASVAMILNDRVDLALELGIDGVHLGQDDTPLAEARRQLGQDRVIGISCHDSLHLAMEAGEQGADYVAFGAFYPTRSKSPDKLARYGVPEVEMLAWWARHTTVPCVAIGGMTPQNCVPMVHAGADFIATITSVWEHPEGPGAAVTAFKQAMAPD